tara:strand:+ start:643 stop:762 length:120 start_codon:yes stop_codon:yes gene_type:complete
MSKIKNWIRRWFCCGYVRTDDVQKIYDEISQEDIWCGEI